MSDYKISVIKNHDAIHKSNHPSDVIDFCEKYMQRRDRTQAAGLIKPSELMPFGDQIGWMYEYRLPVSANGVDFCIWCDPNIKFHNFGDFKEYIINIECNLVKLIRDVHKLQADGVAWLSDKMNEIM